MPGFITAILSVRRILGQGRRMIQLKPSPTRRQFLAGAAAAASLGCSRQTADGFRPLFDGTTLKGWRTISRVPVAAYPGAPEPSPDSPGYKRALTSQRPVGRRERRGHRRAGPSWIQTGRLPDHRGDLRGFRIARSTSTRTGPWTAASCSAPHAIGRAGLPGAPGLPHAGVGRHVSSATASETGGRGTTPSIRSWMPAAARPASSANRPPTRRSRSWPGTRRRRHSSAPGNSGTGTLCACVCVRRVPAHHHLGERRADRRVGRGHAARLPNYDRVAAAKLLGRQGHIALEVHDSGPDLWMGQDRWLPGHCLPLAQPPDQDARGRGAGEALRTAWLPACAPAFPAANPRR